METYKIVRIVVSMVIFLITTVLIALAAVKVGGVALLSNQQYALFPADRCPEAPRTLHLPDAPHDNYLYSDCHSASHVIVTNPRAGDNPANVKPRLLVAWPAGNSGVMALFAPEYSSKGPLGISLVNPTSGQPLNAISQSDRVGISGIINFNETARLTVPILGSVRAIRNYVEGNSGHTDPEFQNNFEYLIRDDGSATIDRMWMDGVTKTWLTFVPLEKEQSIVINKEAAWTLTLQKGSYRFEASFNFTQPQQLSPSAVLNSESQGLIDQYPDQTISLSFMSYKDKLLAGSWRFLTYFGRDDMISMLLMQSVLSDMAIEAVIASVIERLRKSDGTVCHEEVIGEFASLVNKQHGILGNSPWCDYKMVDTNFYLPIAMKSYFVDTEDGKQRAGAFFKQTASFLDDNKGMSYLELAQTNAERIMKQAAPFAASQTKKNLIHLENGEHTGNWRDSWDGIGGGRIPYDVNTALVPAALRAIAGLSRAGWYPDHGDWKDTADKYAQIWEDSTLQFFHVNVPQSKAQSLITDYAKHIGVPSNADSITSDVSYYAVSLNDDASAVPVMNADDCFRHFFTSTQNDTQLSSFLSQTADNILRPFPAGLSNDVGLFVANAGYSGDLPLQDSMSSNDYHGTVVWSWQLSMMAAGLTRQLSRCTADIRSFNNPRDFTPAFCKDGNLHKKIIDAYNKLWDSIDANQAQLGHEVWSWKFQNGKYNVAQLNELASTESNIRQLWSLTFLAVTREKF